MAKYTYTREAVPVGEVISLEIQFKDVAGNFKDSDDYPSIQIVDASSSVALATTSSGIIRTGVGKYKFDLTVPSGFTSGVWTDIWTGTIDGYPVSSAFDFYVDSTGSVDAVGNIVQPPMQIGDEPIYNYSQEEIRGINFLLKILKSRIQNSFVRPDGSPCNVFSNNDLVGFLSASLSEFNATPAITAYYFSNTLTYTTFADIITQGAYLIAMASIAVIEAGREFTLNDNGVTVNPPPVSSTITGLHSQLLSDYRAKLKEIKRNHRAPPIGMGAGAILVVSPQVRRLRHLRERQIL